ncbi:hypothetical protein Mal52_53740 [Symmachiella dynata]|uniref:DUF2971 domain-containing protein n=2 Tax=Symmachiella dynata TaxID=2527995 RepID=A0A517ZWJ7_9PLAN|nr:hypothetical protein Mal52_53740 [Symmachiella dynata]
MLRKYSEHSLWTDDDNKGKNIKYFNDVGQLWFSYPWTFEDDNEGTLPDINESPEEYCDHMAMSRGLTDQEAARRKQRFLAASTQTVRDCNVLMAQLCGVSCWHRNATISSSMWDYATSKNGIAFKTTVGQLERALGWAHNTPVRHAQPSVCAVGYIDYSSYFLEYDDFRSILAIVEEGWSYEDEVRMVAKSPIILRLPLRISKPLRPSEPIPSLTDLEKQNHRELVLSKSRSEYKQLRAADERGFHLPIKLTDLIQEVAVKPNAETTYVGEVQTLLKQNGLTNVAVKECHSGK